MKHFRTLIRLNEHELKSRQKELTQLLGDHKKLLLIKQQLEESEHREKEHQRKSAQVLYDSSPFFAKTRQQIEECNENLHIINTRIKDKEDEMQLIFAEMKKYETLLEREKARRTAEITYKEQLELDEINSRIQDDDVS